VSTFSDRFYVVIGTACSVETMQSLAADRRRFCDLMRSPGGSARTASRDGNFSKTPTTH